MSKHFKDAPKLATFVMPSEKEVDEAIVANDFDDLTLSSLTRDNRGLSKMAQSILADMGKGRRK